MSTRSFGPPSEAQSLILPVTNGCSWNKCTYCEMYTARQKRFHVRDEQETLDAIRHCGEQLATQCSGSFWVMAMQWLCQRDD